MLVHAVRKALGRHGAVGVLLLVGIVVALLLLSRGSSLGIRGLARTTAEEATDGMADGGANGDTTISKICSVSKFSLFLERFPSLSICTYCRDHGVLGAGEGGKGLGRQDIRSSASHLSKQSRAL